MMFARSDLILILSQVCNLDKNQLFHKISSGFATTTPDGTCSDSMALKGQTGSNPPSICGTNTGYHSQLYYKKDFTRILYFEIFLSVC